MKYADIVAVLVILLLIVVLIFGYNNYKRAECEKSGGYYISKIGECVDSKLIINIE